MIEKYRLKIHDRNLNVDSLITLSIKMSAGISVWKYIVSVSNENFGWHKQK